MNNASPSRPVAVENTDEYRQRRIAKPRIAWLPTAQLLVSSLQLLALVYVIGKWDKPSTVVNNEAPVNGNVQELNQNLIKGWHETLTLVKASDEANARLRDQIERLEQRLAQVETAKATPATFGPVAEKDAKVPEKAKE